MDYIEAKLTPRPMSEAACDVLAALLAPIGFDSFAADGDALRAYCPRPLFSAEALRGVLDDLPLPGVSVGVALSDVPVQDWNAAWEAEAQFEPIVIGRECVVHAPQAVGVPPCAYDIVIRPSMSFGTGRHETTAQLLEEILRLGSLRGRDVLDMGTGTGILAILAAMRGARAVRAVEIDDRVADNAADNVLLNGLSGRISVQCGDAALLADTPPLSYDLLLANINRNVLLADMPAYARVLRPGGILLMSGFYTADVPLLRQKALRCGLRFDSAAARSDWTVVRCHREALAD